MSKNIKCKKDEIFKVLKKTDLPKENIDLNGIETYLTSEISKFPDFQDKSVKNINNFSKRLIQKIFDSSSLNYSQIDILNSYLAEDSESRIRDKVIEEKRITQEVVLRLCHEVDINSLNPSSSINWVSICRQNLDRLRQLTTNEIIASEAMQFDLLNDDIYIHLTLVERKDIEQLDSEISPLAGIKYSNPNLFVRI